MSEKFKDVTIGDKVKITLHAVIKDMSMRHGTIYVQVEKIPGYVFPASCLSIISGTNEEKDSSNYFGEKK